MLRNKITLITLLLAISVLSAVVWQSCASKGMAGTGTESISDKYRPLFHFTPDSMWMNDPNGLVYLDGEYHLFYQYYPDSTVWGPMHWGHAISTDLVHWQHLPIALYPDSLGYIFSGSAVVDNDNTSGFGKKGTPAMVAIFTYHDVKAERAGKSVYQSQGIAYSTDKGRSWTKYPGNPVLKNPGQRDFRDPKVSWNKQTNKWILTLASGDHICFYSSPNLKEWTLESEFGKGVGAHGGVWECPDLFEMPVDRKTGEKKWVLLVSINPGGPNGGSATQYFVGSFDGHRFLNESKETRWVDYGKDNYAGVSYSNIPDSDGRHISIGWMSNWQYAQVVPTVKWRSAMTFPRKLSLMEDNSSYILKSEPVEEIQLLRERKTELKSQNIEGALESNPAMNASNFPMELFLEFELPASGAATDFGIQLGNQLDENIQLGYNRETKQFYIRRENSGISTFSKDFNGLHTSGTCDIKGTVKMHLLIDVASVELFANDGLVTMTEIFFPTEYYQTLGFYARNGKVALKSGVAYKLNSLKEK
ncbi:MAG: glycoside hydrolase family 32 protein [Bacteroidales bacterium]|nr:glycoside hydrolase family 32 protein [Bacteroidales bacterium]